MFLYLYSIGKKYPFRIGYLIYFYYYYWPYKDFSSIIFLLFIKFVFLDL